MASAIASRLDGLSEITELERIPLPYKTLYHTLVFKNDMPVDLLKERHQTGTQQLLTWIQAALKLVDTVVESQLLQRSQRREEHLELLDDDQDEEQEELEIEIQDMVSGFGHYEPTIESSIEILLQLEECISNRTLTSNKPEEPTSPSSLSVASSLSLSSTTSLSGYTPPATHLGPEIEQVMGQWSRLRDTVSGLGGSIREHQRIRDGIQSVNNIAEQTYQATQLLEKCLKAIAQDKRNCRHAFEEGLTNLEAKGGLDGNDMLELDSMVGLLSLQIESLQTSFPECVSATNNKSHPNSSQAHSEEEHGGLAPKKTIMASLYQDLLEDWNSLRRRKEQLWRDLEECDRWRARIEKMARQIESMLEPVEIFHKMCANLLGSLEEKSGSQQQHLMAVNEEDQEVQSPKPESLSSWPSIPIEEPSQADLEMLASTLQELEEKQNMVAPAIENMFWVQEGEIQHQTKHVVHSPSTPSTAIPPSLPHSPTDTFAGSPLDFSSPLYPNLPMLERQRGLKARWSNLKASLDTAGTQLQQHHVTMTERANAFLAMKKRQAEEAAAAASVQEEKARISTEVSEPSTPTLRRSSTNGSQRISSDMLPGRNTSTRILRGTLVPSISMDSPTVKKYMLLKGDKPASSKPRPWCPSINPQSPGLPGFPLQTSSWGYFLISTSQSMDSFGSVIATPAPVPIAPPPAPTPPPPKFNRPPFSPAGPRLYSKPTPPPTRPAPQRPASVAGGDYSRNRCMSPTISWENKMVCRSNSTAFDDKSPKSTNRNSRQGNNNQSKSGRKGSVSSAKDGSSSAAHAGRRSSIASDCNAWYGNHHRHSIDNSSSEDETVTGEFHANSRMSRGYKNFNKQGLRTRTKQNDSSSSLDSMMSSSGYSYGGRGYSSLSSHGELRSPSPPLPLPYPSAFGSSFATARSTAALHTALLSSMSSHSSSSFRNSGLSFSSSQRTDSQQSEHDGALSSKHSSGSSVLARRQVYHQDNKPSSWMGSGSLISALSFRVPTYSFEEDFGSFEATAHEGAVVN
ncbi:hypothetical protein BG006_009251, partial [Podila minutissima]